ncbi:MAG: septum site-determining protein MinC [Anaerolineae bacterium]|nr:septum site-determining protein MinC [Anaerolineae bacterium]
MGVTLKGTQQGIILTPRADNWDEVMLALEHALQDAESFFRGGRVIAEMGARSLTDSQLTALRAMLEAYGLELWAVLSDDAATIHIVRSYGIRTRLPGAAGSEPSPPAPQANSDALFVQRTFRSGQRLNFPGHVTILGDVNPGAEIIAGGNIVVWGRIRGMVHAGAMGDVGAVICALDLAPSQLRIAGLISRAPEERRRKPQPEIASISQDRIIAQPWTARG